ncbi:MAG: class I SAM-dependent methyltransferase [Candidatus Aenigmarchaeota archaeon]|nr:class I SAM-dependent methyltransferase [Candidatus Aenigmarchaeota archaeon]
MKEMMYGDMYKEDRYVRKRYSLYRDLLLPHLKDNTKILDIGGYMGNLLDALPKDRKLVYYDLDFDQKALDIAKAKGAKTIKVEDLDSERMPVNEKFDIIVATELFEHLKNPEFAVNQIKGLIKSDGVILISLPNECTIFHRLMCLIGKGIDGTGFDPYYHLHFPTIRQSREFVGKHFNIIEKRYWVHGGEGGLAKMNLMPDSLLEKTANWFPGLFSRGTVFLCRRKQ